MNYLKFLIELKKSREHAKLSAGEIQKKQEESFYKLMHYADEHSAFYHKKFADAGITAENMDQMPVTAFPTTNKEEIIGNFKDVLTEGNFTQKDLVEFDASGKKGLFKDQWHVVHSSGSTGIPRYFVYDEKAWQHLVVRGARSVFWGMSWKDIFKLAIGKINILYVAVTGGMFGGAMMISEAAKMFHAGLLELDVSEPLSNWKKKVENFGPTVIAGYPSALMVLTEELNKAGVNFPIKRLISCGEALSSQQRAYMENYYGIPVVNFYAATESLAIGVETDGQSGMVLFDDMNYIEILDGAMYLTNLYNYIQPLIRYSISDSVERMEDCSGDCGFSRCRVKRGRAEDMMWFADRNGRRDFIHPTLLEDFCLEGLLGYQFLQDSLSSFHVNLSVAKEFDSIEISKKLHEMIRQLLVNHKLDFVSFETRVVDHITPDAKTGKCRLCVALPRETA